MLVAGKELGEDVTNGAAARPVVAAREGRWRVREKGETEGGDVNLRTRGGWPLLRRARSSSRTALLGLRPPRASTAGWRRWKSG